MKRYGCWTCTSKPRERSSRCSVATTFSFSDQYFVEGHWTVVRTPEPTDRIDHIAKPARVLAGLGGEEKARRRDELRVLVLGGTALIVKVCRNTTADAVISCGNRSRYPALATRSTRLGGRH